ncbi:hypothetical protein BDV59DRAFT_58119 [Aspergillus ambiguus]|uniref:putative C6 finger domain protein n=1 Tax=Aspergillus ambiguus TaxID=176160 RepID=UPI003CCCAFEC
MADTATPTNAPEEPPRQAGESQDTPASDAPTNPGPTSDVPTSNAPANETPVNEAPPTNPPPTENNHTLDNFESTLPPIDKSLPAVDSSLPSLDTSLPPMDPSIPSLPSIDTSLPPLDTTLPAMDASETQNFTFSDANGNEHDHFGSFDAELGGGSHDHSGIPTLEGSHEPTSNGIHSQPHLQQQSQPQHSPTPQQPSYQQQNFSQQQQPHQSAHPPNQYAPQQGQPPQQGQSSGQVQQPQQYQQHSPDMYQNHQAPSSMGAPNQSQPSHIPQAPIGSPMPAMSTVSQYMTGYPSNVSQMGMNTNAQMRYQLPGDPNKMLSGGRHKKEVKRRTKTGCLTCRKRRIKCDEGHPVCRNCVKSKRECLGYDPVFKQQPTPSAIQPAPNPHPSLVVNPQDPAASTPPTTTSSYPAAPPGYVPAVSQPFAPSESPSTSTDQYNYGASIDPSLDGTQQSNMASVQSAAEALQPTINPASTTSAPADSTSFKVKQVQISDLLALRGIPPPPPHPITAIPPNRLEEIKAVFLATYAPAIDKFFETRWFSEKALSHLLANAQLMAEYSALIDAFEQNLNDPNVLARLESFEASVVWSSMTLCRHVMNVSGGNPEYDLLASSKRLDVIEAMITGEHLESNPLAQFPPREPAATPPSLSDQLTQRSLDFWSCVGHFLTLHDNEASSAKEIDDTLARCRTLLDTFENRDVIYSVAIARHLGQRWADFPRSFPQPITTNEKDAGAKLYVAQKFLEQEAGGKGTTQVIKRLCGMVVRSWIVSRE